MTLINQKLRSSRGATMIYALAALLIITIVSFLVISSASVNVGRVSKTMEGQQAYLTVSSAASLVQKAIDGEKVEVKITTVSRDGVAETPTITSELEKRDVAGASVEPFGPILERWVKELIVAGATPIVYTGSSDHPIGDFLLTETVDDGAGGYKTAYVRVHMEMKTPSNPVEPRDGYNLEVTLEELKPAGVGADPDAADSFTANGVTYKVQSEYAMCMEFNTRVEGRKTTKLEYEPKYNAAGDEIGETVVETVTQIVSVKWNAENISKKGE